MPSSTNPRRRRLTEGHKYLSPRGMDQLKRRMLKALAKRYHWALKTSSKTPVGLSVVGIFHNIERSHKSLLYNAATQLREAGKIVVVPSARATGRGGRSAKVYAIPKEQERLA